ncbi:MAG: hypothetical protein ACYDHD_04000 [Vulcanimicrobiaceae bacterium]
MRRWETLTALAAVIFASVAALPWRGRLPSAVIAIVLIAIVGLSRLRSVRRSRKPMFDAYERARRIHEERDRRLGR